MDIIESTGEEVVRFGDSAEAVTPAMSAFMYRSGAGRDFVHRTESRCNTCKSPFRGEIEEGLLLGRSMLAILNGLPFHHGVSVRSLKHHALHHSDLAVALSRAVYESEMGDSVDEATDTIITAMGLLKNMVRMGGEGFADGSIRLNGKEVLGAAQTIVTLDHLTGQNRDDIVASRTVMAMMAELARKFLSEEDFAAYTNELTSDPEFIAIRAQHDDRRLALAVGR